MTSHQLAKLLLDGPDEPLALSLYGHSYITEQENSHGPIRVSRVMVRFSVGEYNHPAVMIGVGKPGLNGYGLEEIKP